MIHSKREPLVTIIIPTYNDAGSLISVLRRFKGLSFTHQIAVVDDGSTDSTKYFLRGDRFKDKSERLVTYYFKHMRNQGKGASIRTALEGLKLKRKSDIIVIQDADLEYDPTYIHYLLDPIVLGHYDFVYGSRFIDENGNKFGFLSFCANKTLSFITRIMTGLPITDMETGHKAFRADCLKDIKIEEDRFGFEPEITLKMVKAGYRFKEVPITYHARSNEQGKKIRAKDFFLALGCLWRYRWRGQEQRGNKSRLRAELLKRNEN